MEDFQTLKPIHITKSLTLHDLRYINSKQNNVTYLNRQTRRDEKKPGRGTPTMC